MTYFLDRIEKLVSSISNTESCLLNQNKGTSLSISNEIENIPLSIKDKLLQKSAQQLSKKKLSSLISFYHSNLIRLIDELSKKQCSCPDKDSCHKINIQPIILKLANTLIFINNQFKDFINHSATLPLICETNHRTIIKERYHTLLSHLINQHFSAEMIFIMVHPLNDFINQKKSSYTYHDKFFLYAWLERLESVFLEISTKTDHNYLLCKLIIANNLNSEECIEFFILYITDKYKIEATRTDQLQVLSHFLKCIKQTVIIRESGYILGKTSLHETLTNWLTLEIDYIKNSCHINERRNKEHKTPISIKKIETNLTVPQLAVLLRLGLEVGIFSKEQSKEILKHYSKYFSTIGTTNISYDSLYNKFRKPTEVSLETIKDIILNQLKIIQKKEF